MTSNHCMTLRIRSLSKGDGIVTEGPLDDCARPKGLVKRPVGWFRFIHHYYIPFIIFVGV